MTLTTPEKHCSPTLVITIPMTRSTASISFDQGSDRSPRAGMKARADGAHHAQGRRPQIERPAGIGGVSALSSSRHIHRSCFAFTSNISRSWGSWYSIHHSHGRCPTPAGPPDAPPCPKLAQKHAIRGP